MTSQLDAETRSIHQAIRDFVVANFLFGLNGNQLTDQDSFIGKGILDSTGVLELSQFVEETYRITIRDDELAPDNFDSIERLARYIARKRNE